MTLKPLLHAIGVTTLVTPDVRETRKDRNECTKRCFTRSDFLLQSCGISIMHNAARMKKVIMNNLVQLIWIENTENLKRFCRTLGDTVVLVCI